MGATVYDPRSIEEAYVLTGIIRKGAAQETATLAEQLAPLDPVFTRKVKVKLRDTDPAGLGQFKAINAATPIRTGGGEIETHYIELVDLEEKEVISAADLRDLYSADKQNQQWAVRGIVDMTKELARRNRNLTNWMRWQMFKDALTITYADGGAITLDFDMDNTDGRLYATHLPDVSGSAPWSTAGSDVIGTVRGWTDTIGRDCGIDANTLVMNKTTWRYLQQNSALAAYLSESYGPVKWLSSRTVAQIVWDLDPDNKEDGRIVIENGYYENEAGTRYYWLPDGYVLLTSPAVVDGSPIAKVFDGPVVTVSGNDLVVGNNPGLVADMYTNAEQKTKNVRVATSRMPWMRRECFMFCKVY